jgi:hypothetical protein
MQFVFSRRNSVFNKGPQDAKNPKGAKAPGKPGAGYVNVRPGRWLMKNVQVIDEADNCTYSIYAFTDDEFDVIFPESGQNIEFIEDVIQRVGDQEVGKLLAPVWKRVVKKSGVVGIRGTLFYGLSKKKKFYPTKREEEMIVPL